jgi:hypothetical protein
MADVIKKNTKTLSLKNPTSSSLTKIIKDKLDVDINNIKGSDIPRLFKQGLKFKGILGKRIIDGISSFIKKNPDTKKQYEKFLPDSLKKSIKKDKKIVKTPTNITPKKIKKIDISNIMKNPRTGRGQNLPTRVTDKNKNTGTNLTKRVLEGEVLQGLKKPKGVNNRGNQQTVDGKFQNITPKSNRISNIRTPNLNVKGIRPKAVVDALNDFPKFKTKEAPAKEIKKVKPPKDFTPKIKTPKTPKVIKKELPKLKSNDYTGRFIDKKGDVAYDSFSDFMAHMTGKPKKRKMPKKTARIIGTGDKLKRKDADKKGAGKGVKFKAFKSGTKDKTIGKPMSPKDALNKKFKEKATMLGLINNMGVRKPNRKKNMVEKIFGGGPDEIYKIRKGRANIAAVKEAQKNMKKEYPELMKRITKKSAGKTVGLKDLPPKSQSPGIHKLPAKAKMNMGFKPMFGGGFISSLYDKPEKTEKYKGNTTSARQVKGYGKAKKKA